MQMPRPHTSISIPGRFNGPEGRANGGYASGVVADLLGSTPAEVNLRRPVPLDTPLDVARAGDELRILAGSELIADGHPIEAVEVEVAAPVGIPEAREAMKGYQGASSGPFSHCFVCGRARTDACGVHAGPVEGREVVASTWAPPAAMADANGHVPAEVVTAVLDCPTYFAAYVDEGSPVSYLARFRFALEAPIVAGRDHVVIAWPIGGEGRKRRGGSAILTPDGEPLAIADALLVEPREAAAAEG